MTPDRPERQRPVFRRDVQGLRALAVVLVVLFHSGVAFSGGFLGVDVFFVISGFVIGRILLADVARDGRIALGRFYARRVRRLFPALAVMLLFVAAASILLVSPLGTLRSTVAKVGAGAAFYVGNFAVLAFQKDGYFDVTADSNPLLHTWTLGVEEQFYLFLPLVLIVAVWSARRHPAATRRRITIVVGVLTLGSFVAGAFMSGGFGSHDGLLASRGRLAFYSSFTRAWEFLAGVLIACAEPHLKRVSKAVAGSAVVAGVTMIVAASAVQTGSTATPGPATLVPVAGTVLVILAGTTRAGWPQAVLGSRVAVWIGDRSYGWYLWHWPFIVFVATSFPTAPTWVLLAAGIAALGPTVVSYRWLEQPIRHDPAWLGRGAVRLAVGCGAVAGVAFLALASFPTIDTTGVRIAEDSLADRGRPPTECLHVTFEDDPRHPQACTWAVDRPTGWVVLAGDSMAGVLARELAQRVNAAGYNLNVLSYPGCPFADVTRVYDDPDMEAGCAKFVEETMRGFEITRPALVVLASRQDAYVRVGDFELRDPVTGVGSRDSETKEEVWRTGLTRTLRDLRGWGVPGAVVATVPDMAPFSLELCPAWRLWFDPAGCTRTLPRSAVEAFRAPGRRATEAAVRAVPDSHLVDFIDQICGAETCSTARDDAWIYADAAHLSPVGAAGLGPAMDRQIVTLLTGE